jgi:hypothetical protein
MTSTVNTNLKALFNSHSTGFDFPLTDVENNLNLPITTPTPTPTTTPNLPFNTTSLFFFHFNSVSDKTVLRDGLPLFQRTATVEQVEKEWNLTKEEMTMEFKRKHKSAARFYKI